MTAVIDSTAFRRGVRAFKTGTSNPYNGPELRDEWEAGRAYAANKSEKQREMARAMAAVDTTYDPDYMAAARARAFDTLHSLDDLGAYIEGYTIGAVIAKATGSAS